MVNKLGKTSAPDYFFLTVLVFLVVLGFIMLTSASSDLAELESMDSYFYLQHQLLYGFSFGLLGFLVCFFVNYRKWQSFALPLLLVTIILLAILLIPGLGEKRGGSTRWLSFGPISSFQPSELVKLSFLLFLSFWVSKDQKRTKSFLYGFLPLVILLGVIVGLLIPQPSTSTAVILCLASAVAYFVAGSKLRFFVAGGFLVVAGVAILLFASQNTYRMDRITGFLNPDSDPTGKTYHINQALTAIGSGGLTGVGFGKSVTKLNHLPEPIGDSIFAVISEEFGFIGSMFVVVLFFLFVWRGFIIAKFAADMPGRILVVAFTSLIGIQAFVNMASISGLIPLTGVPLPFISYGGTALAVFLTMSGIIANISRYRR